MIYPYSQWGSYGTSSDLYVYGRQIPFRSYFGQDVNLTARPISRVIEPNVIQYAPVAQPPQAVGQPPVSLAPTLVPAVAYPEAGVQPLKVGPWLGRGAAAASGHGAQVSERSEWVNLAWVLLAVGALSTAAVVLLLRRQRRQK